ncbi:MAG: hypothetical protein ACI94Y_004576 [Maribacter sp.]|jgi:hypothetical protein
MYLIFNHLKSLDMKNLKFLILAVTLAFSTSLFANNGNDPVDDNKDISTVIYEKLTSPDLNIAMGNEKEVDVLIKCRVNRNNEIVVMGTNAEDEDMDGYIKGKLNYEILDVSGLQYDKMYFINVKFQIL